MTTRLPFLIAPESGVARGVDQLEGHIFMNSYLSCLGEFIFINSELGSH